MLCPFARSCKRTPRRTQFGVASVEVSAFRAYTYRTFHLDYLPCPPARTVFLQRGSDVGQRPYGFRPARKRHAGDARALMAEIKTGNRDRRTITNNNALMTIMRQKGIIDLVATTTMSSNSTEEQVWPARGRE